MFIASAPVLQIIKMFQFKKCESLLLSNQQYICIELDRNNSTLRVITVHTTKQSSHLGLLVRCLSQLGVKCYFLRPEKKVAFVFIVVESLSNLGKSMSMTKLSGKIGIKIFPDFEVP